MKWTTASKTRNYCNSPNMKLFELPITIKEMEFVILKLPKRIIWAQMVSLENSTKCLKNSHQIYTIFPENRRGGNTSQLLSLNQYYPDAKTRHKESKRRRLHSRYHLRSTQNGKEELKLSLFANNMVVYTENLKGSTQTS